MPSHIAESKFQFSDKFVAVGIMKKTSLFGIQPHDWSYLYYLLKSTFV